MCGLTKQKWDTNEKWAGKCHACLQYFCTLVLKQLKHSNANTLIGQLQCAKITVRHWTVLVDYTSCQLIIKFHASPILTQVLLLYFRNSFGQTILWNAQVVKVTLDILSYFPGGPVLVNLRYCWHLNFSGNTVISKCSRVYGGLGGKI